MRNPEVTNFLRSCKNYDERKFWITRVYDHLLFANIIAQPISIPRALTQTPYLSLIAAYRDIETTQNRSVTTQELHDLFDAHKGDTQQ